MVAISDGYYTFPVKLHHIGILMRRRKITLAQFLCQIRKLELLIAMLVFVMAGCYFGEMSYVKPPASDVMKGMFIPKLSGTGATGDAIALLGALVMPYDLHSSLFFLIV
jgi:Mn2+/Fe2+ NRAMP family transporter